MPNSSEYNRQYYTENKQKLNAKSREWAKTNREKQKENRRRSHKKRRQFLNDAKTPCVVCGWFDHPCGIDFHHLNPEEKSFSIGQCCSNSLESVKAEIEKCVCLCANCHRLVEHTDLIDLSRWYQRV